MADWQKWTINGTSWVLDYTLAGGLNLVANTNSGGTSGLYGLTGEVVGGEVELFATNFTLSDLDPTFLYGITDTLAATTEAPAVCPDPGGCHARARFVRAVRTRAGRAPVYGLCRSFRSTPLISVMIFA